MKHIKLFEEYSETTHKSLDSARRIMTSNVSKKIIHILSLLDDVVHLDFKNIRNTYKNKEGYRKANELVIELTLVIQAIKMEGDRAELGLFYDMKNYGFDIDMILDYLDDEEVKAYLRDDRRGQKSLEKHNDAIEFMSRYRQWRDNN